MKILISGICGFTGATLARRLAEQGGRLEIYGLDNLSRNGSEVNRRLLRSMGIQMQHGDVRSQSDVDGLPQCDWVLDTAAKPSVLAGIDGTSSSRQLIEHNLNGTINLLEYCKRYSAGFTLLSTSRVYAISPLASLEVEVTDDAFVPRSNQEFPTGISCKGVSEMYSTATPVSLYGCTKRASEALALEYGAIFDFPVWINRCGVLAGAGQFGHPDQGIFSYWINSWIHNNPLKYIGFDGLGYQVRDCLHPADLVLVLLEQMAEPLSSGKRRIMNFAGGIPNSMSLAQLSRWCGERFGVRKVESQSEPRPYDIPWMVVDSTLAKLTWNWEPTTPIESVLEEISLHAETHPEWLDISAL